MTKIEPSGNLDFRSANPAGRQPKSTMSEHSLNNIEESIQKGEAVKHMLGKVLDFVSPDDWDIRRIRETLEENKADIKGLKENLEASQG